MANYETSKYTLPATATGVIPGTAIETDSLAAAEIATNAITSDELADNAVDTNAILNSNVTGAKIANSTISINKLNASGTRNVGTFLSGNNTFETISVPPSAVSAVRYRAINQTFVANAGSPSGQVTPISAITTTYVHSGPPAVVKATLVFNGDPVLPSGGFNPPVNNTNRASATTNGTLHGHSINYQIIRGSGDVITSETGIALASLSNGQILSVTTPTGTISGQSGGGGVGTYVVTGVAIFEVTSATTI